MSNDFYDRLGEGYDTVIDWEQRLDREASFYQAVFARHRVRSVIDTACGTGEHAALFASWGLQVVGADISAEMIAICRRKYGKTTIEWVQAGFGETFARLRRKFDAVTCLGNSWPHVLTDDEATTAADDFAHLLEGGGVLLIQQLNYEAMRLRNEWLLGPQARTLNGQETLFLRIFDLDDNPVRFTMLRITKRDGRWTREQWETRHRAWSAEEMERLLIGAGFSQVQFYGDFAWGAFDRSTSDQMIVLAQR